jgi:hypothetical protein
MIVIKKRYVKNLLDGGSQGSLFQNSNMFSLKNVVLILPRHLVESHEFLYGLICYSTILVFKVNYNRNAFGLVLDNGNDYAEKTL